MKMLKWKEAIVSYHRFYEMNGSTDTLGHIANCYEELFEYE